MEPDTTLVVTAHGDSMMPEIGDGDIVFIDTAAAPTNGDHVLLFLDEEALIKEYHYNPDTRKLRLIPINRKYEVIEIAKRSTRLRIVGVVAFSFHKLRKRKAITLGATKATQPTPSPTPPLLRGPGGSPRPGGSVRFRLCDSQQS